MQPLLQASVSAFSGLNFAARAEGKGADPQQGQGAGLRDVGVHGAEGDVVVSGLIGGAAKVDRVSGASESHTNRREVAESTTRVANAVVGILSRQIERPKDVATAGRATERIIHADSRHGGRRVIERKAGRKARRVIENGGSRVQEEHDGIGRRLVCEVAVTAVIRIDKPEGINELDAVVRAGIAQAIGSAVVEILDVGVVTHTFEGQGEGSGLSAAEQTSCHKGSVQ